MSLIGADNPLLNFVEKIPNALCCCNCNLELTINFQGQDIKGVYNGPLNNDFPSGRGMIRFNANEVNRASSPISYTGELSIGRQLSLKLTDQIVIDDGALDRNNIKFEFSDNNAIIEYEDGGRFEGEVNNGELVKGKMTYSNGDIYVGYFNKGQRCGEGELTTGSSVINGTWETDNEVRFAERTIFKKDWLLGNSIYMTSTGAFKRNEATTNRFFEVGNVKTINHDYNFSKIETYNDQGELHGNVAVLSADGKHIFVGEYNNSKLNGKYNFWKVKDDYTITEYSKRTYN